MVRGDMEGEITTFAAEEPRPEPRDVEPNGPRPPSDLARRVVVTLVAVSVPYLLSLIVVPGIDAAGVWKLVPGDTPAGSFSFGALGLLPALSAYLLVELCALAWPRWRFLRIAGPEGRGRLRRPAVLATVVLALVQGHFVIVYLQGEGLVDGGFAATLLPTVCMAAGALALLGVAGIVERYGIGCGVSALFLAGAVPELARAWRRVDPDLWFPFGRPRLSLWLMLLVCSACWALLRHRRAAEGERLRGPTSGLVPATGIGALLGALLAWVDLAGWFPFGINLLLPRTRLVVYAVAIVVGTPLLSFLFNRPRAVAALRARVPGGRAAEDERDLVRRELVVGTLVSATLMGALLYVDQWIPVESSVALVLALAVGLDLAGEVQARLRLGTLAAVWPLHQVYAVDPTLAALRTAGIPAHARGAHHRALLHFFGPYVPIQVLVPVKDRAKADEILERLLIDPAEPEAAAPDEKRPARCPPPEGLAEARGLPS